MVENHSKKAHKRFFTTSLYPYLQASINAVDPSMSLALKSILFLVFKHCWYLCSQMSLEEDPHLCITYFQYVVL